MPSILFVHGAGHGAWCWHGHFTPWFEARGYIVAAPDLPHHGDLDRRGLKTTPLSAYVDAVASAAGALDPPLILVGHSMGGFIIQKYLESAEAELAILLASTPPAGARGMVRRMATRRPVTFLKTMMTGQGTDSPNRTRDYFFSPGTPAAVVNDCHRRLQPESMQALKDMMTPLHPERVTTPVVVVGAESDWLVAPPKELAATARAYHTAARTLPGGHDMMLDTAWEQAAVAIQTAIAERHARRY
jgi:pimeloyl-ACP methyl ester carboxylesterase